MVDAIVSYIPELIGGVILVFLTFWLTSVSEKSKSKLKLENQQNVNKEKIEKLKIEYEAKVKKQELAFKHQIELLEKQHMLDLDKQRAESKDRDMRSIFTGEYDLKQVRSQMGELGNLLSMAEQIKKMTKGRESLK